MAKRHLGDLQNQLAADRANMVKARTKSALANEAYVKAKAKAAATLEAIEDRVQELKNSD